MMSQMGSPISVNSQSGRESKHTPPRHLERIRNMWQSNTVMSVHVGVSAYKTHLKITSKLTLLGERKAEFGGEGRCLLMLI